MILTATYWLTVAPTVSFWDCPEYVAGAWLLEIGHPPGNPVWMLTERVITMLAPSARYAALAVNLSSGLFTALAAFFLAKLVYVTVIWISGATQRRRRSHATLAAGAALTASLSFGWCDSIWYSAVEAEVYAMSIFLTAVMLWIMMKWAVCRNRERAWRYLLLIAYITGLSIGVHQLNLLCLPALALIWAYRRGFTHARAVWGIILISLIVVGAILTGMMPSTIALAARIELMAVNGLRLPMLSGVAIYIALLGISLIVALAVTTVSHNRALIAVSLFPPIYLSGLFIFDEHFSLGAALTAIAVSLLVKGRHFKRRRINLGVWMLAMLLTGYSAYALIPIRGDINSPANPTLPGNPFSFAAYQARAQYGSAPLLYGRTPESRPMIRERFTGDSVPDYSRVMLSADHPIFVPRVKDARLYDPYGMLTREDSILNSRIAASTGPAYLIRGYRVRPEMTPELNMWLPRITSTDPADRAIYADWTGMTPQTMVRVPISEVIDTAGNQNTRLANGKRSQPTALRPTYLQHLTFFTTYQLGYMYLRYLMWNFAGRQNDMHSTGEVEHGNFITGFNLIDNAMLGAEDSLPPEAGSDNPGRNTYWGLPLILGIIGAIGLLFMHKPGRHTDAVIALLFVMSGIAIVVYLNQSPGEPRERDYSFPGSYFAFAAWIGLGAFVTARKLIILTQRLYKHSFGKSGLLLVTRIAAALPLIVPVIMFAQNIDDHNRSGRRAAAVIPANFLSTLEPDAILFVSGDNQTFPLWYASEVEGIRRDVAIINTSYLVLPEYAAARLLPWRDSAALPSTLGRESIIYNAMAFVGWPGTSSPRIERDAVEALRELRDSPEPYLRATHLRIPSGINDSIVIPVNALARTPGGKSLDFKRLFVIDVVATNASSSTPRPVYWHRHVHHSMYAGLRPHTSPALFGRRFGYFSDKVLDSLSIAQAARLELPNDSGRYVYMDGTPARQIEAMRAGAVLEGHRMLAGGKDSLAAIMARVALERFGPINYPYSADRNADSIYYVARELGRLLRNAGLAVGDDDMAAEGLEILRRDSLRRSEWEKYKLNLPPHLRSKVSRVAR